MNCDHISKVLKWGVDDKANLVATLYGCINCDWESGEPHVRTDVAGHTHTKYVEGCFACKIKTLELGTGDANGALVANGWTNKKWDGELKAYRDARAQGIQPASTKMKDIQTAVEISNKSGQAFSAS
jgi:hypothetical protein